jgi:hypothetical protein
MSTGWIKSHRQFLDWEWFKTPGMFQLFHYLLYKANHKPKKWQGITIERGQLITGRCTISRNTGLSEQVVRTCLKRLKSTSEITIKSTNKFSIITICNYDQYQGAENEVNQHINQLPNQQLTSKQPATNQQLTTTKELKNEKNEKKNILPPAKLPPKTTICTPKSITHTQLKELVDNPRYGDGDMDYVLANYEEMFNWSQSGGKRKKDWLATLRNWIIRERKAGRLPHGKNSKQPKTFRQLEDEWFQKQLRDA